MTSYLKLSEALFSCCHLRPGRCGIKGNEMTLPYRQTKLEIKPYNPTLLFSYNVLPLQLLFCILASDTTVTLFVIHACLLHDTYIKVTTLSTWPKYNEGRCKYRTAALWEEPLEVNRLLMKIPKAASLERLSPRQTCIFSCINGFVILCYLCTLCTIKCVGYFKTSFSPTLKGLTIMEVVVMSHMSDLTVK